MIPLYAYAHVIRSTQIRLFSRIFLFDGIIETILADKTPAIIIKYD